ncbi:cobyrinate a,c-diamide synthase, partial [Planctomycetota bacterium]
RRKGFNVAPFKKGPDYIDAAWLGAAAGKPARNLDVFIAGEEVVAHSFMRTANDADVAVIEANRGLYDGVDAAGTYSSAEISKLLKVPVILVLDCSKTNRTVAAIVLGCQKMDPAVDLRGVILNQTVGARHEKVLRDSITQACGIPVLGVIPRQHDFPFPERHLGLVPPQEHGAPPEAVETAGRIAEGFDLDALWKIAQDAPALACDSGLLKQKKKPPAEVRIGICRDQAFHFYYPENLEALQMAGAELLEISPIHDACLPAVDALYIGGGFPESFAQELSANTGFRASLAAAVAKGLPVYAECGGAVYLGTSLELKGGEYAFAGILPLVFGFDKKPRGHGYTIVESIAPNPFYPEGVQIKGHEFHYSFVKESTLEEMVYALEVKRGHGIDGRYDGACVNNVLAVYMHVHALATPEWAPALVRQAIQFKQRQ